MPEIAKIRAVPRRQDSEQTSVMKKLEEHDRKFEQQSNDSNLTTLALQGVQKEVKGVVQALEKIALVLGNEEEDGAGNFRGTGIVGRTRRNESEVRKLKALYHRWIAWGAGFTTCAALFLVAMWWLIGDKLAIVLKGH